MGKPKNIVIYSNIRGSPRLKMALCWVAVFCKNATLVGTSQEILRASLLWFSQISKHEWNYGLSMDALVFANLHT